MIDRVDKRLVFKPLNNRPFFHGETELCINGRILAIGSYFKKPNRALANQNPLSSLWRVIPHRNP
jgi:hypothetical protein